MRAFSFTVLIRSAIFIYGTFTTGLMLSRSAIAQVASDGTLSTTVIQNSNNFTINNGNRAGNNLFHSFDQFSVPTGGEAFFNNAMDVQNIFSRVTGGNLSNIDGLIRANGTASLFLLNPSGILFGPNASLNIGGSFIGTTANSLQFNDGVAFSAVNTSGTPLLTMSVPIGLQMGNAPAPIQAQGTGYTNNGLFITRSPALPELSVNPGNTLALVGGNVELNGFMLSAPQGQIALGSTSNAGQVNLLANASGYTLGYEPDQSFGDIQLIQKTLLDVSGFNAGAIELQGRNIRFTDGAIALALNYGDQSSGDIRLQSSNSITISGTNDNASLSSGVRSEAFGLGASGNIIVTTPHLTVSQGAQLNAITSTTAAGGNIQIAAKMIELTGSSLLDPTRATTVSSLGYGAGQAGDVSANGESLVIADGAALTSTVFGFGNSGRVMVQNTNTTVMGESPFGLYSNLSIATFAIGNTQDLTLNTAKLKILNGGTVGSSAFFMGSGGNVNITATDEIVIDGASRNNNSSINASTVRLSPQLRQLFGVPDILTANAGNVTATTPDLILSNGGTVTVTSQGSGNSGNLTIAANTIQLKNQGFIQAQTESGHGGNIDLQVRDLVLIRDRSSIAATAGGSGDGGNINIHAPVITGLGNGDIVANAVRGRGGNIQIETEGIIGLQYQPQTTAENDITASSQFGVSGTVQVNNIGVDPNSGIVNLPEDLADPTQQIAQSCAANQASSFVVTGRGGRPLNPTQQMRGDRLWTDTRDLATSAQQPVTQISPATVMAVPLIQATGWQQNANGQVELFSKRDDILATTAVSMTCSAAG